MVVLISGLVVLIRVLEDVLGSTFGGETIRAMRVGIGLLVTVTGVAGYHLVVFRHDRAESAGFDAEPTHRPVAAIVFAPADSALPAELAATGLSVRHWPTSGPVADRADDSHVQALAARASELGASTGLVAVVATPGEGAHVIALCADHPTGIRSAAGAG
jgi:Flp pilus assembly protein CpaB